MKFKPIDIQVTCINRVYHARLFVDGKVFDEMSCKRRCDIGWICREMLRWYDKLGGVHPHAASARRRHNEDGPFPPGIKYLGKGVL